MEFLISLIFLVVMTCIVTLVLTNAIRSRVLTIVSAVAITELTVLLVQYWDINQSYDPHMAEILYLPLPLPIRMVVQTVMLHPSLRPSQLPE